jgi:hypothetical protein
VVGLFKVLGPMFEPVFGIKCQKTINFNKCFAVTDYSCPSPCPQLPVRLTFYEFVITHCYGVFNSAVFRRIRVVAKSAFYCHVRPAPTGRVAMSC